MSIEFFFEKMHPCFNGSKSYVRYTVTQNLKAYLDMYANSP